MSDAETIPEGFKTSVLAPGEVARCVTQDAAAVRVREQMLRYEERLLRKQCIPLLMSGLYVMNCDKHEKPCYHVDMINSPIDKIAPELLPHAITAVETLLRLLKARQG